MRRLPGRRLRPLVALVAEARRGDERAVGAVHELVHPEVQRFAFGLVGDPAIAGHVATAAIDDALASRRRDFVAAALAAVQRLGRDHTVPVTADTYDERTEQVALILLDDEGLSASEAAAVLGMPPTEVLVHHARGRRRLGVDDDAPRCSGWALVCRLERLTPVEAAAAHRHLELCPRCTAAHQARLAARGALRQARTTALGPLGRATASLAALLGALAALVGA